MTTRTDILSRIINLRDLANNNTSEAEAMAALTKANRMMQAYHVEEAELAMAEATGELNFEIVDAYTNPLSVGTIRHKVQLCLWNIAAFCDCKCIVNRNTAKFMGDAPDAELAVYLTELIQEAMDREYSNWRLTQQSVGRGAKGSFQISMGSRINSRLGEMQRDNEASAKALMPQIENKTIQELGNTALVVVAIAQQKKAKVEEYYKAAYAGVRLGKASNFSFGRNGNASQAGREAGSRVHLGRSVGSTSHAQLTA